MDRVSGGTTYKKVMRRHSSAGKERFGHPTIIFLKVVWGIPVTEYLNEEIRLISVFARA